MWSKEDIDTNVVCMAKTEHNASSHHNFLAKNVNGYNTRNKFVRSMDIANAKTFEDALKSYCTEWFSSRRKQYLNEAFKQVSEGSKIFWPKHILTDMIEEISVGILSNPEPDEDFDKTKYLRDVDKLCSKITLWSESRARNAVKPEEVLSEIKSFERKYKYPCPDTFKTCWMNHGAYVTLSYGIKYEGLRLPNHPDANECLNILKGLALTALGEMDHFVDTRMFELCYDLYKSRYDKLGRA